MVGEWCNAKAHELYSSGKNEHFNLMSEWLDVRNQSRYGSQVGGNTGPTSSGSKRSRESDASDSNSVGSNSVGSSARPMGREAAKKRQIEKQMHSFGNRQRSVEWIQTIQRERIGTIGQNSQDTREEKSIDERKDWNQKNEDVLEVSEK